MAKNKTIFMETTSIDWKKTISEIQFALLESGASGVSIESDPVTKLPTFVAFKIKINDIECPFLLPARVDPVFKHINQKRPIATREKNKTKDREQAYRVAWRQILKWVQAQCALIEIGMVEVGEVFLPYLQVGIGQTLYHRLQENNFRGLLTAGGKAQ